MRFVNMTSDGVTETEVDDRRVLVAHKAEVSLSAAVVDLRPSGLMLLLSGHTVASQEYQGSIALLDVETAAQIVLGIEATICSASSDMQRTYLEQVSQQRGGH